MTNRIINLLILVGLVYIGYQCQQQWKAYKAKQIEAETGKRPGDETLPGLPRNLEDSLAAARRDGAEGLKNWLQRYRRYAQDPRLAEIELDYVVLVGARNLPEAQRVLSMVKRRTSEDSPLYERVTRLSETYE